MRAVLPYGCADGVRIVRMRVDRRAAAGMVRRWRVDHGGRSRGGYGRGGSDGRGKTSARGADAGTHGDHPAERDMQNSGEGETWKEDTAGGWYGEIRFATGRARSCWWTEQRRWRTITDILTQKEDCGRCTY